MKKIVLVVCNQTFTNPKGWETYQRLTEKACGLNPEQGITLMFHNTKMHSRKELSMIPAWPKIILFDECHHGTIKKVHNVLSRKNKNILFYAKNFGVKNHEIEGINTIEKIEIIPLHLTAIKI